MTRVCGVIGKSLRHSISAVFQQAAFDALGLDVRYHAWELAPEDMAAHLTRLQLPDALGCNVTIPYKLAVLPFLARRDSLVDQAGAANTLVNDQGILVGHNTDVGGFLRALRTDGAFDPVGTEALLLGAGGAARAVAVALLAAGVTRLWIANRSHQRAAELAAALANDRVVVLPWHSPAFLDVLAGIQLIVNATPAGMLGPGVELSPLPESRLAPGAFVFDLVANPRETRLMREASENGARVLGGLPMLVYQGAESFELWTGLRAPVAVMRQAAEGAMRG
ncbi:MAG TPA: shikimate dehydrogenase [Chloroflexota bacterium]|nr:shikimate dehydrogenase [Chloroflexota bacterium]